MLSVALLLLNLSMPSTSGRFFHHFRVKYLPSISSNRILRTFQYLYFLSKNGPTPTSLFRLFSVFSKEQNKSMWKISIQNTPLGFEPTTSRIWVICHNHKTRAPALYFLSRLMKNKKTFLPGNGEDHEPTAWMKYTQGPVWPDWAKFHHFGNILNAFFIFVKVYLAFGKILNLLWQFFYAIGSILTDVNSQILNK